MSAMSPVNGVVQSKSAPDLAETEERKVMTRTRSLSFGDSISWQIDQVQTLEELEQIKATLVNQTFWDVVFAGTKEGEKLGTSYTSWSKSMPVGWGGELQKKIQIAERRLKQASPSTLTFEKEPPEAYQDNAQKMRIL